MHRVPKRELLPTAPQAFVMAVAGFDKATVEVGKGGLGRSFCLKKTIFI